MSDGAHSRPSTACPFIRNLPPRGSSRRKEGCAEARYTLQSVFQRIHSKRLTCVQYCRRCQPPCSERCIRGLPLSIQDSSTPNPKEHSPMTKHEKPRAQLAPDKAPLTASQATALASLTGIDASKFKGLSVAEISSEFRWQIDPNLLLFT